jgi:Phosphate-selective porin O and P
MNREVKSKSMLTTNKIGAALLLGCALGASELAAAAGQTESPAATPAAPAKGTPGGDSADVKALQKQLKAVQAQLRELAEQNKALLEHQKVIDRELQQHQRLLAQQAAAQAQLSAQAGGAQGAAGAVGQAAPGGQGQRGVAGQPGSASQAGAQGQRGTVPSQGQVAQSPAAPGAGGASTGVGAAAGAVASATPSAGAAAEFNSALPDTTSPTPEAPMGASGPLATLAQNIKLWGYGEIYYMNPTHDRERAQADLARAVFGIGYSFDSRTEFNSEYEVEHAVSSASDPGEFEVEQFYVDRQLNDAVTVRGGLFLMPFGLLNEHHEPTNFYGVQRNFVETLIIPSTWREGGLNFHGDTQSGFGWNVGVTTGFDLSKWDFAPEFPQYTTALELEDNDVAPLQATHQELALANGHDLSQYVALSYFGVPGLTVGGAIATGKAVSVAAPPNAPIAGSQRVTLWEGHARWTPDKFDLSALYAHGSISNLAGTNAENPGSPNPIPSTFYGYYFQAAYDVWQHGDYRLSPFTRWEVYNMGSSYEGTPGPMIPTGSIPLTGAPGDYGLWPRNFDRVWTIGANLYVTPHVVLKLDYQHFLINNDFTRVDLGLGLNF